MNITNLCVNIFSAVFVTLIVSVYVTGIDIMANLHMRLELTNTENIRMLDGMHEGLLVLNKSKDKEGTAAARSVAFCNRPAQRLFSGFVGNGLEDHNAESFKKLSQLKSFAPLKRSANKASFDSNLELSASISLEHIIMS